MLPALFAGPAANASQKRKTYNIQNLFLLLSKLTLRSKKSVRGSTNRRILLTQRMLATHRDNLETRHRIRTATFLTVLS